MAEASKREETGAVKSEGYIKLEGQQKTKNGKRGSGEGVATGNLPGRQTQRNVVGQESIMS